jgi:hypothetical protein
MDRKRAEQALGGIDELFSLGESDEPSAPAARKARTDKAKTVSVAVHMGTDTRDAFEAIANEYEGVSRSSAMRYALRWFLHEYREGRVELKSARTRRLQMPD